MTWSIKRAWFKQEISLPAAFCVLHLRIPRNGGHFVHSKNRHILVSMDKRWLNFTAHNLGYTRWNFPSCVASDFDGVFGENRRQSHINNGSRRRAVNSFSWYLFFRCQFFHRLAGTISCYRYCAIVSSLKLRGSKSASGESANCPFFRPQIDDVRCTRI